MERDLIGQTLGKYRILEEIGRGGMATVYKAYQSSLNRHVAIKVMAPFLAQDREFRRRFKEEALATAALDHPNIIHIYDADQEAGYHYIAMEYVAGGNLHDRLKEGRPLDVTTAVSIATQIGAALDHAHRHGFIHRDVKPSNILLGREGRAVLTDLGIAKAIQATRLTRTGTAIGTPEYMSPEQAQGAEVDHRTDIYSLGIVVYEMLAGQVPFQADTPLTVLYKQVNEPPPDLTQVNPDVGRAIAAVVTRALAKDREHRFHTAQEMIDALHEPATLAALPAAPSLPGEPTQPVAVQDEASARVPRRLSTTVLRGSKVLGSLAGRLVLTALKTLATLTIALGIVAAILLLVFSVAVARYAEGALPQYPWNFSLLSTTEPNRLTEADFDRQVGPYLEESTLGIIRGANLDFDTPDSVEASGTVLGIPVAIQARLLVVNGGLQIELEHINGLSLPVVGDTISSGVNRGLEAIWDEAPVRVQRIEVTSTGLSLWVERK